MSHTLPVILITGASRGLGRGIALHLAQQGYSLVINYASNAQAATETVSLCKSHQVDAAQEFLPIQANIVYVEDRKRLIDASIEHFNRLDCLVNNAGIAPPERNDILQATENSFDTVIETNLKAPYFLTQMMANYWLDTKIEPLLPNGFTIIFVTSISTYTASLNRGEYCIAKAGLSMARQLWAARLAEEGISVIELRPGIMETDMTTGVKKKYDSLIAEGLIPQKRWGQPEDLGKAVSAIVRGEFPFSAGAVIDIDGGFQLRIL